MYVRINALFPQVLQPFRWSDNGSPIDLKSVDPNTHADSIAAIKRSLAQAALGELEDAEQFLQELEQQHRI
jgi:hypothetical protein